MPTSIVHHRVNIVTLEPGETIADCCRGGDIALLPGEGGWWIHFVADDGSSESYEEPYATLREAMGTARAAAEFSSESD